jgi:molybdopterin adenylyltransferase
VTPEATLGVIDRSVPGIVKAVRSFGKDRTTLFSRGEAGVRSDSIIVNLPAAPEVLKKACKFSQGLIHILTMLQGKGHDKAHE